MICEALPNTGAAAPLDVVLTLAVACVIAGAVVLLAGRRARHGATVAVLLLAGVAFWTTTPRPASASGCPGADMSLTIVQTSVMVGMAPGIDPVAIAGIVANHGSGSTYIDVVEVEIASVTTDGGPEAGVCDATDYVLLDTRMHVGRTLGPDGSTRFSGASIGFSDKSTNQDVCKGATVHLRYIANPG